MSRSWAAGSRNAGRSSWVSRTTSASDLVDEHARADERCQDRQDKRVDPQQLQVQLTDFLNKQAQPFVAELWKLCWTRKMLRTASLELLWSGRRRSWCKGGREGGERDDARGDRSRSRSGVARPTSGASCGPRAAGPEPEPRAAEEAQRVFLSTSGARARRPAAGQARAAAALALEGVAEHAGRLLLYEREDGRAAVAGALGIEAQEE